MIITLSKAEVSLLEWLGKEDCSQCFGSALDSLVRNGLAQIYSGREFQSGAVSLTEAGRHLLSALA
jgi:hypothetical protein